MATVVKSNAQANADGAMNTNGMKNHIINGGFDIWQRGTSFIDAEYTADRWWKADTDTVVVRELLTDIQSYGINCSTTTAVGVTIGTKLEDVSIYNNKNFIISLKAKSSTLSQLRCYVYYYDTSGVLITSHQADDLKTLTTDLKDYSFEINVPDLSSSIIKGTNSYIFIRFDTAVAAVQDFTLAQVQLEQGSVQTPFEQRPYGLEKDLCRFYYKGLFYMHGDADGDTQSLLYDMRATPSVSLVDGFEDEATQSTVDNITSYEARVTIYRTTASTRTRLGLILDAEIY